jgi:hypothetical protein
VKLDSLTVNYYPRQRKEFRLWDWAGWLVRRKLWVCEGGLEVELGEKITRGRKKQNHYRFNNALIFCK